MLNSEVVGNIEPPVLVIKRPALKIYVDRTIQGHHVINSIESMLETFYLSQNTTVKDRAIAFGFIFSLHQLGLVSTDHDNFLYGAV